MKPGLAHISSKNARRSSGESSNAAAGFIGWWKPWIEVLSDLAQLLEAGPQLGLLLGGDGPVVQRRAPVGGALVHGERRDLVDDGRHHLHAARRGADDGHPLAGEVDRLGRPPAGVVLHAAEVVAAGDVGEVGHRQHAGGGDEEPGPDRRSPSSVVTAQVPDGVVPDRRGDRGRRTACGGGGRTGRRRG